MVVIVIPAVVVTSYIVNDICSLMFADGSVVVGIDIDDGVGSGGLGVAIKCVVDHLNVTVIGGGGADVGVGAYGCILIDVVLVLL